MALVLENKATTVTTTATKILSANAERRSFILQNLGFVTVFLGHNDSVTTSIGIEVEPDERYSEQGIGLWKGDVFGIATSGSQEVRSWER